MKKDLEKARRDLRKAKRKIRDLEGKINKKPSIEFSKNVTTTLNGHREWHDL